MCIYIYMYIYIYLCNHIVFNMIIHQFPFIYP